MRIVARRMLVLLTILLLAAPGLAKKIELDADAVFLMLAPLSGPPNGRVDNRGFRVEKDPNNPLHLASSDCTGQAWGTAEAWEASGHCLLVTRDGKGGLLLAWSGNQQGGTWSVLRGHGTLAGAKGGGSYVAVASAYPEGKGTNRNTGTIEIP